MEQRIEIRFFEPLISKILLDFRPDSILSSRILIWFLQMGKIDPASTIE